MSAALRRGGKQRGDGGGCFLEARRHRESLWEGLDFLGQVGGDLQLESRAGELGVKGSGLGLADLQA